MNWDRIGKVYIALMALLMYVTIIFAALLSFNTSSRITFPMEGFTLHWYIGELREYEYSAYIPVIHHAQFWEAWQNSLILSFTVGIIAALVVTTTALALRRRVIGRTILFYVVLLGFLIPGVTLGLGNFLLHRLLGIEITFWSTVGVNVAYAVPFGLILMMARFDPALAEYENVARILKASPLKVVWRVTIPLIRAEVWSAGVLGFLLSWGELIRSQFLLRGMGSLSIFIARELGSNPMCTKMYAMGTLVAAVSISGLLLVAYLQTRRVK